ncbi:hypothetical protein BpHYR1_048013 [Brachionus plicatilis]|uniref:Uncharacterized protein n=1 Tax=Brachionus plicatilis TaxID=10195 RepID=A0A3M7TAU3_BRAPC|nr:hypothetical protein BpHYR1_048013 [Brachionus plicatilis]
MSNLPFWLLGCKDDDKEFLDILIEFNFLGKTELKKRTKISIVKRIERRIHMSESNCYYHSCWMKHVVMIDYKKKLYPKYSVFQELFHQAMVIMVQQSATYTRICVQFLFEFHNTNLNDENQY